MDVTTPDIIAEASALLARAQEHVASVAAYAQAQAEARDTLADERDAALAQATDLQRQLDAARARIAELEGVPATPPTPATPTLVATPEADGLRLAWTNARRLHIVPTKGRHLPVYVEDVASAVGADVVSWQTLREQWDGFGPGWELSAWASSGNVASAEAAVVVPKPKPAPIPAEPVEPLPPIDLEQPSPTYTGAPENARFATNADEADRLLSLNRNDGHPVVITSFKSPRAFRLQPGNRNVWFINVAFEGLPGGMTNCPISGPVGVGRIYVQRCQFIRCGAGLFLYDFSGEIVGNTFRDGGQAIGILWRNASNPTRDAVITHNVMERLSGHDVELRTEHPQRWGSLGPTIIGAKFNYNRSTGSPGLPTRSMIYSLATGHARDCEAVGNYSEGGEWAFEVMNGWTFRDNTAVDCDAMFAINTLSKLVTIGTGNRAVRVRAPVMPYVSDRGAPSGIQPGWKIAEVARQ